MQTKPLSPPLVLGIYEAQVNTYRQDLSSKARYVKLGLEDSSPKIIDSDKNTYDIIADTTQEKDYRVGGKLGEGAFTYVFELIDDPHEVLKLLKLSEILEFQSDMPIEEQQKWTEMFKRRFITKASLPLLLSHPGLEIITDVVGVEVMDFERGVMWVPGMITERGVRTLSAEYQNYQPEDFSNLSTHAQQIASALDFLSSNNIELSDTKADNIMLRNDNSAFIADIDSVVFDLAKLPNMHRYLSPPNGMNTFSPTTSATVAPEMNLMMVEEQHEVQYRTSQYSLACMLWTIFIGNNPVFRASRSSTGVITSNTSRSQEFDLLVIKGRITKEVWEVFNKALAFNPRERFENCTAFIYELIKAIEQTDPATTLPDQDLPQLIPEVYA